MKILHYMFGIPPVRGGGLVRYAMDLMSQEMQMGEEVLLMIPGTIPKDADKQVKIIKRKKTVHRIPTYMLYHPLPIPMCHGILDTESFTKKCDGTVYADFLQKIRPDVIHIHTLMGLHREFLEEAEKLKIPSVFTTHDYFGICPTANMMFADSICEDSEWKQCKVCSNHAYSMKKMRIEQSEIYRIYRKNRWMMDLFHKGIFKNCFSQIRAYQTPDGYTSEYAVSKQLKPECMRLKSCIGPKAVREDYAALRNYYKDMFGKITWFHFNSTLSENIYHIRLGKIMGAVIPISHSGIRDCRSIRSYGKILRLGYLGGRIKQKGFFMLLNVCRKLYGAGCRQMELHVYADAVDEKEPFLVSHDKYNEGEAAAVFEAIDILIVPSICPETFGLVVPEALSYGVPVLLSERVGAKDLVERYPDCGIRYDGTAEGLESVLLELYQNRSRLEDMNRCIQNMRFSFSYEEHVKIMLSLYRSCIDKKL